MEKSDHNAAEKNVNSEAAVVLAMFGTSVEKGLPGLLNIRDRMAAQYPATPIRLAFTSGIIRHIWHQRAEDADYRTAHPEIPQEILTVPDPVTAVSALRDEGYNAVIVQAVYMAAAGEYQGLLAELSDLNSASDRKDSAAPPPRVVVGRPVFGIPGHGASYTETDIIAAARALADDAGQAREGNAALLYMGHGDKNTSTAPAYQYFAEAMNSLYPDVLTVVSTVEGDNSLDDAIGRLRRREVTRVILKPFMVVAGNHVRQDMLGSAPHGWKKCLEAQGFTVEPVLNGLGEHGPFADIFVRHAAEAGEDAGIWLR